MRAGTRAPRSRSRTRGRPRAARCRSRAGGGASRRTRPARRQRARRSRERARGRARGSARSSPRPARRPGRRARAARRDRPTRTTAGTSPPGPFRCGSTTWSTKPVAHAASKAFPPRSSTAIPVCDASQWVDATIPKVPRSSGRVVNTPPHSMESTGVVFPRADLRSTAARRIRTGAKFCNACGAPLAEPDAARRGATHRLGALRRPRRLHLARRDARPGGRPRVPDARTTSACATELESFGGTVEKFVGDAVMGVFGAPTTYGDDAGASGPRGVRRPRLGRGRGAAGPDRGQHGRGDRRARARGPSTARRWSPATSSTRPRASRPPRRSEPCSSARRRTRARADAIEYRPAPARRSRRARATPVRAWLAARADSRRSASARPAPVPMIGRERELGVLTGIWERVSTEEGRAHFVTVFGPPGIGKSRLALELVAARRGQGGARDPRSLDPVRREHARTARSHSRSSRSRRSSTATSATEARSKLAGGDRRARRAGRGRGARADTSRSSWASGATETSPTARRSSSRRACFVESLAHAGADDAPVTRTSTGPTRACSTCSRRSRPACATCRCCSSRSRAPSSSTERPGWGGGLPAYTALPLDPLHRRREPRARRAAARRVERRATGERRPSRRPPRATRSSSRSSRRRSPSGRPRTSSAADERARDRRGAARLRFRPRSARVLVDASVVGRVFWRGALAEIADARRPLGRCSARSRQRDLVRREAVSRIKGDQQFGFKHGLIHDVAYGTLPRAARRDRHAAVARFLEASTAVGPVARGARAPLARGRRDERAVEHLIAAAEQAGRGWAKEHARRSLRARRSSSSRRTTSERAPSDPAAPGRHGAGARSTSPDAERRRGAG